MNSVGRQNLSLHMLEKGDRFEYLKAAVDEYVAVTYGIFKVQTVS